MTEVADIIEEIAEAELEYKVDDLEFSLFAKEDYVNRLERLLSALYGRRWDTLTLYQARKKGEIIQRTLRSP